MQGSMALDPIRKANKNAATILYIDETHIPKRKWKSSFTENRKFTERSKVIIAKPTWSMIHKN